MTIKKVKRLVSLTALLVVGGCLILPLPAYGSTSFGFLFSMNEVTNDNQLFLNLTVSNLGYSRAELEPVLPRISYLQEDLPVVLFVAHHSGNSPEEVVALRNRGLSWSVIFQKCDISPGLLFAGFDADPGPPYGKAWGHWRKERERVRLNDSDVRGLVQLQLASRWARVAPREIVRAHHQGRSVQSFVADRNAHPYRSRGKHHGRQNEHSHGNGRNGHENGNR